MQTILQLNRDELRAEIRSCILELIDELKNIPKPSDQPDRILLLEACEITRQSKAQIYKLSMKGEIPVMKFGKHLVFSRKELISWMESRTKTKKSTEDEAREHLAKDANKKLNKY